MINKKRIMRTIKRLALQVTFSVFPINNKKVFFSSYEGKQYSCNPKSIYEAIKIKQEDYCYIWEYNKDNYADLINCSKTKVVRHNTLSYFYHLLTSKYIITNSGISASIPIKKRQINLNTWHGGGAYKKVGAVIPAEINGSDYEDLQIAANQTTYFLSSSRAFTELMVESTLITREKFVEIGMPRNDVFFSANEMRINKDKVRLQYGITNDQRIVLYAPTYRGKIGDVDSLSYEPHFDKIVKALNKRFDYNWVIFYRAHYHKQSETLSSNDIIDVTNYPDMQQLLCAADVLITDYSSSIWDYSFTQRPCFLLVPDLMDYQIERGGFYSPIETWPGIVAQSDDELVLKIEEYNEDEYKSKVLNHHINLMSFENGEATQRTLELLNLI